MILLILATGNFVFISTTLPFERIPVLLLLAAPAELDSAGGPLLMLLTLTLFVRLLRGRPGFGFSGCIGEDARSMCCGNCCGGGGGGGGGGSG